MGQLRVLCSLLRCIHSLDLHSHLLNASQCCLHVSELHIQEWLLHSHGYLSDLPSHLRRPIVYEDRLYWVHVRHVELDGSSSYMVWICQHCMPKVYYKHTEHSCTVLNDNCYFHHATQDLLLLENIRRPIILGQDAVTGYLWSKVVHDILHSHMLHVLHATCNHWSRQFWV